MKLKGIYGFVEIASIGLMVSVVFANYGKRIPEIYYIVCLMLLIIGIIGFVYLQIIRARLKQNSWLQ